MQTTKIKSALSMVMLAVFSTFMSISFQSCSTDDGDDGNSSGKNELDSPVVGKWTVGNQNADYGSFEFTVDKKYIISQRVSAPPSASSASVRSASETVYIIVIFGDISSLSNSDNEYTLDLSEFGVITINIDPAQGTATVTVNGETYTATKEKEMNTSTTLDLLCHTWDYTIPDEDKTGVLTFTKSGTYLAVWGYAYEDGTPHQGQDTFKLLSSNKIQITESSGGEGEEALDYTIEKLTESECILAFDEVDPSEIFRIYLTR
jgi:hypothetical protein